MSGTDKIHTMVTDIIIRKLEEGTIPWKKCWTSTSSYPRSLKNIKKNGDLVTTPYYGINIFLLSCQGFSSPYWITWKKCSELGGHVLKGESKNYCPVIFWKINKKQDKKDENLEHTYAILRYYRVYNIEQTSLADKVEIPGIAEELEHDPIESCQEIIAGYKTMPELRVGEPSYNFRDDFIRMPSLGKFDAAENYYSTIFHEMTHSTGHSSRLSRKMVGLSMDRGSYSKEELIAEMGASMLCSYAGIDNATIDMSAAYIGGWLKCLRNDHKMIIKASSEAHKAFNYILGNEWQE